MTTKSAIPTLSRGARCAVLAFAFFGLVFDGLELALMPVASLSVSQSFLGEAYTKELGGLWFARFTAALMLGAALGGILLGNLGDRVGRARAMGVSILFYSIFAGLGAYARTLEQMLLLRFAVGLGVGGMWPNGVALAFECWPKASRPLVSGILGAGINVGMLCLAQMTRLWPLTPDSWQWVFQIAAAPAVMGLVALVALPESPQWLASRRVRKEPPPPVRELFSESLWRVTLLGIVLASVPLVGAWAGSKWMIPWADQVASATQPGYKSVTQGWWALGATIGSFAGAPLAHLLGRRASYFVMSIGATSLTWSMFRLTAPLEPNFLPIVFTQGLVATLFFGWLPLYLPELFPLRVRATGSGLAMNVGRFLTAGGVLATGSLFSAFNSDYASLGAACSLVYGLGAFVIWWAPNAAARATDEGESAPHTRG